MTVKGRAEKIDELTAQLIDVLRIDPYEPLTEDEKMVLRFMVYDLVNRDIGVRLAD